RRSRGVGAEPSSRTTRLSARRCSAAREQLSPRRAWQATLIRAQSPDRMCGIVAMASDRGDIAADPLARAVARLEHRGPDAQRWWIAPHRRAALGHARLSIIDLVTGDQPIASEDERLRIVVNGEFYDYERIQRELEERGHRLRTRSDSEIAL